MHSRGSPVPIHTHPTTPSPLNTTASLLNESLDLLASTNDDDDDADDDFGDFAICSNSDSDSDENKCSDDATGDTASVIPLADISDLRREVQNISGIPADRFKLYRLMEDKEEDDMGCDNGGLGEL